MDRLRPRAPSRSPESGDMGDEDCDADELPKLFSTKRRIKRHKRNQQFQPQIRQKQEQEEEEEQEDQEEAGGREEGQGHFSCTLGPIVASSHSIPHSSLSSLSSSSLAALTLRPQSIASSSLIRNSASPYPSLAVQIPSSTLSSLPAPEYHNHNHNHNQNQNQNHNHNSTHYRVHSNSQIQSQSDATSTALRIAKLPSAVRTNMAYLMSKLPKSSPASTASLIPLARTSSPASASRKPSQSTSSLSSVSSPNKCRSNHESSSHRIHPAQIQATQQNRSKNRDLGCSSSMLNHGSNNRSNGSGGGRSGKNKIAVAAERRQKEFAKAQLQLLESDPFSDEFSNSSLTLSSHLVSNSPKQLSRSSVGSPSSLRPSRPHPSSIASPQNKPKSATSSSSSTKRSSHIPALNLASSPDSTPVSAASALLSSISSAAKTKFFNTAGWFAGFTGTSDKPSQNGKVTGKGMTDGNGNPHIALKPRPQRSLTPSLSATIPFSSSAFSSSSSPVSALSPTFSHLDEIYARFPYPPSRATFEIKGSDMVTLKDGEELNDTIMDVYLYKIQHELLPKVRAEETKQQQIRAAASSSSPSASPRFHYFNTFFYTLLTNPDDRRPLYERVKRWTKDVDLFECDYIFIPIHAKPQQHWSLAVICHPKKWIKLQIEKGRKMEREGKQSQEEQQSQQQQKQAFRSLAASFDPTSASNSSSSFTSPLNSVPSSAASSTDTSTSSTASSTPIASPHSTAPPSPNSSTSAKVNYLSSSTSDQPEMEIEKRNDETANGIEMEEAKGDGFVPWAPLEEEQENAEPVGGSMTKEEMESNEDESQPIKRSFSQLMAAPFNCKRPRQLPVPSQPLMPARLSASGKLVTKIVKNGFTLPPSKKMKFARSLPASRTHIAATTVTASAASSLPPQQPLSAAQRTAVPPPPPIRPPVASPPSDPQPPCLLYFDSLGVGPMPKILKIRDYLGKEYRVKKRGGGPQSPTSPGSSSFSFSSSSVSFQDFPVHVMDVPLQSNGSDCGLFVLHYIELLSTQSIRGYRNAEERIWEDWFDATEAEKKRHKIRKWLNELHQQQKE